MKKTETNPPGNTKPLFPEKINIIYDSKCSVCQWEVDHLQSLIQSRLGNEAPNANSNGKGSDESSNLIKFTDLESEHGYNETDPANAGVTYEMGMRAFHAVLPDGTVLHGMPVFRKAYEIVEGAWIGKMWEATNIPIIGEVAESGYDLFAKVRTWVTRGASVEELIERHYGRSGGADGVMETDCEPCKSKLGDS